MSPHNVTNAVVNTGTADQACGRLRALLAAALGGPRAVRIG